MAALLHKWLGTMGKATRASHAITARLRACMDGCKQHVFGQQTDPETSNPKPLNGRRQLCYWLVGDTKRFWNEDPMFGH
jgi:hypothetical protein